MDKEKIIKIIRSKMKVLKGRGVKQIGLFGSYAKGTEKRGSDIDILIMLDNSLSLGDLVDVKMILERYLRRRVDLVEYKCIHPLIKKQVMMEEIRII